MSFGALVAVSKEEGIWHLGFAEPSIIRLTNHFRLVAGLREALAKSKTPPEPKESLWDAPTTIGMLPIPQNIARIDRELARVLAEQDRLLEAP